MNLAELFVFLLLAAGVFYLLRPLKKRLDRSFYRFFRTHTNTDGQVIDITDSLKKDPKKDERV